MRARKTERRTRRVELPRACCYQVLMLVRLYVPKTPVRSDGDVHFDAFMHRCRNGKAHAEHEVVIVRHDHEPRACTKHLPELLYRRSDRAVAASNG